MNNEEIRTSQLKSDLETLKLDILSLNNNKNEIFLTYIKQINEISFKKIEKSLEWKNNEIKSAQKYYEGQIYSLNCDFNERYEECKKQISKFTIFKYENLIKEMPEIYKYFINQKYDFWDFNKINFKINKGISIIHSKEQILTDNEINEDVKKIKEALSFNNLNILLGQTIEVSLKGRPNLIGIVGNISENYFELILKNKDIIKISFIAIKLGNAQIKIISE